MNYPSNIARSITVFCIIALLCIVQALFVTSTSQAQSEPVCTTMNEILLTECASSADPSILTDTSSAYPNQFLIGLEADVSDDALNSLLDAHGLVLKKRWKIFDGALVELKTPNKRQRSRMGISAMEQARIRLESEIGVRYATYNERFASERTSTIVENSSTHPEYAFNPAEEPFPNDPEFPNQWALPMIRTVDSWSITQGDPDVVVAIIDSGYNLDHPDLGSSHLWINEAEAMGESGVDDNGDGFVDDIHGWDWVNNSHVMSDAYGHGTAIGGIIAATTNNEIGISSVGRNVKLMPLTILDSAGGGYINNLIDALEYAANVEEVRIINLSLSLQFDSPLVAEAIARIAQTKFLVAGVGNTGENVYWPAAYPETIAVAATDEQDRYAELSNRGPQVDFAAPGVDILSTDVESGYTNNTGTDMAAAYVSALAALITSLRPDFTPEQIRSTIADSAIDINIGEHQGVDDFIGHGRIDIYQSLLDASAGLQIDSIAQPDDMQPSTEDMVDLTVRVHTPISNSTTFPVQNAVVQYELISENEPATETSDTPSTSGQVLTDAVGKATITIPELTIPENYLLRTTVGQASAEFSLAEFSLQVKQKVWIPIMDENR